MRNLTSTALPLAAASGKMSVCLLARRRGIGRHVAKAAMSSLKLALGCAAGGVLGYVLTKLFDSPEQQGKVKGGTLTIGYWKIRGLGAPLRMMCCYAGQPFVNKAYGDDAKTAWFGSEKKRLKDVNALINLPYVIEGPTAADPTETVVTQSNSCLLYLGKRLGIDRWSSLQ